MPRDRINAKTKIKDPWATINGAVKDTLEANESDLRLLSIMQAVNDLVIKGQFDEIYKGFIDPLREHFKNWHEKLKSAAGDPLLTLLSDQYDKFKKYCKIFPRFYTSYDQHFKDKPNKILNSVRKLFVEVILSDTQLFSKAATPSIINVILNAQKGSEIDLDKVKNIIQMYYSFNNDNDKKEIFEDFYDNLNFQEDMFYDSFFKANFETSSFTGYLNSTRQQYKTFKFVIEFVLNPANAKEILEIFNQSLLQNRESMFLLGDEPKISEALTSDNLLPMKYLVDTYSDFEFSLAPLYEACSNFIMTEMLKLAQDFPEVKEEKKDGEENKNAKTKEKAKEENVNDLIRKLIDRTIKLCEPYNKIFTSKEAINEINKKIKKAWNNKRFNITQNFNDYIDSLITSKFKGYKKEEQYEIIPRFYQYLDDKTAFNRYYDASFVRRLIRMRSNLEEYEYMLIKLIQRYSTDFMQNFDNYKKALSESDTLTAGFNSTLSDVKASNSLEPFVIDSLVFPLTKTTVNTVPSVALQLDTDFQKFYLAKHAKKELTLVYHGSLVELTIKIPYRRKAFSVTMDLYCACVICALSQRKHKYSEIVALLNNNNKIASKVVTKLYSKAKLITSPVKIVQLSPNDEFLLNPLYNNDKTKVYIPPVFKGDWRENLPKYIELEKTEAVKCAIVRSLKQRQRMEIGELERDIIDKLNEKFEVKIDMIKHILNDIDGKYFRRDTVNGETILTYIY